MTQEEIAAWLIEAARRHETVVRLQTGDPTLYGALIELTRPLAAAGIAWAVVPGVTSATAAMAAAGETLTLPEVTQTVILTRVAGRTPMPAGEHLAALAAHRTTLCIYLSITLLHEVQEALLAAGWMRAAGKSVVLDGSATRRPIPPKMAALVAQVDVLICGAGFGATLTGREDPWEIGRAILDMGPAVVVQTEGKAGSYTTTRADQFHTPSFDVNVMDTTGAGDVFHGAYIVGMLRGWDVRRIVQFATAVSALKCTGLGGRRPSPCFDQVTEFLRERGLVGW